MKIRKLALALSLLGLIGCQKQVPIEEDTGLKQRAIEAARAYVQAIKTQDLDFVVQQSVFPYWLDRDVVDAEGLKRMLAEEAEDLARWQLKQLRFFTEADISIFAPRMIERLKAENLAHTYFVVAQFTDSSEQNRRPEAVLFVLQFEQGQWKFTGLED